MTSLRRMVSYPAIHPQFRTDKVIFVMSDKPQKTFYFHDYETFGKNPALDRPAQFAGVRTDEEFNIIEEPLVIYCRPSDDYLPEPEAVMITGITPQIALERGLSEAEFTAQIHQAFSVPATRRPPPDASAPSIGFSSAKASAWKSRRERLSRSAMASRLASAPATSPAIMRRSAIFSGVTASA